MTVRRRPYRGGSGGALREFAWGLRDFVDETRQLEDCIPEGATARQRAQRLRNWADGARAMADRADAAAHDLDPRGTLPTAVIVQWSWTFGRRHPRGRC